MSGAVVTVIVLNYNGKHLMPRCLDALAKQDVPDGQLDVWVVDNDSKDGSAEFMEREYPWVRTVRNGRNAGFGGGNNVGLRQVTTPYVVLLNNDTRPEPDWARKLIAPLQADTTGKLGAVSAKIVFLPRFVELSIETPGFDPGPLDGRELGARVYSITVNGAEMVEHVLWEASAYGPEGEGPGRFRWTRAAGPVLVPASLDGEPVDGPLEVVVTLAAEKAKPFTVRWDGGEATAITAGEKPVELRFTLPAGTPLTDVINNAGSVVSTDGYGADRAYQEVDRGQYETAEDVFAFCGGSVAFRKEALDEVGIFDEDFFLYYEDTDLSWRLRSAGWRIAYEPTAVTRHIHAASSVEWSPFFVYHVDLNRLLMLTKNATRSLALREVLRYPVTTASLAARELARSRHTRRRPPVRPTLIRLKVVLAYARLLPGMLAKRRSLRKAAVEPRAALEQRWLVPPRR